jgi:hypothetical protein
LSSCCIFVNALSKVRLLPLQPETEAQEHGTFGYKNHWHTQVYFMLFICYKHLLFNVSKNIPSYHAPLPKLLFSNLLHVHQFKLIVMQWVLSHWLFSVHDKTNPSCVPTTWRHTVFSVAASTHPRPDDHFSWRIFDVDIMWLAVASPPTLNANSHTSCVNEC